MQEPDDQVVALASAALASLAAVATRGLHPGRTHSMERSGGTAQPIGEPVTEIQHDRIGHRSELATQRSAEAAQCVCAGAST